MGKKVLMWFVVMATLSLLFIHPAFADSYDPATAKNVVTNALHDGTHAIYRAALSIVLPLSATLVGWAGVQVLFNGEKGLEQAKKILLRVTIAIMAVYLTPSIVVGIHDIANSGAGGALAAWTIGGG